MTDHQREQARAWRLRVEATRGTVGACVQCGCEARVESSTWKVGDTERSGEIIGCTYTPCGAWTVWSER